MQHSARKNAADEEIGKNPAVDGVVIAKVQAVPQNAAENQGEEGQRNALTQIPCPGLPEVVGDTGAAAANDFHGCVVEGGTGGQHGDNRQGAQNPEKTDNHHIGDAGQNPHNAAFIAENSHKNKTSQFGIPCRNPSRLP